LTSPGARPTRLSVSTRFACVLLLSPGRPCAHRPPDRRRRRCDNPAFRRCCGPGQDSPLAPCFPLFDSGRTRGETEGAFELPNHLHFLAVCNARVVCTSQTGSLCCASKLRFTDSGQVRAPITTQKCLILNETQMY
jgi:hypothetical protein